MMNKRNLWKNTGKEYLKYGIRGMEAEGVTKIDLFIDFVALGDVYEISTRFGCKQIDFRSPLVLIPRTPYFI